MAVDQIRYDLLAQDALRGVVRRVLQDVVRDGLPGDHHFYIAFDTRAAGVRLSPRLRERYPEEMTIVLQHQFWDLAVTEFGFEVGLSFAGVSEKLVVPFSALKGFFDPSVQFGLQFEVAVPDPGAVPARPAAPAPAASRPATVEPAPALDQDAAPAAKAAKGSVPSANKAAAEPPAPAEDKPADGSATVVRLDTFRKK